jgi:NADH:ubiquinone oxidoreductase subunit E
MGAHKSETVQVAQPLYAEVAAILNQSKRVQEPLAELIRRYPDPQGALLEVLWLAQAELGWLPHAAVQWSAEQCGCSPVHAWGVATFYTMYKKVPTGRFFLQICQNVACHTQGAEEIIAHAEKILGISSHGGSTADGLFTLARVECLGACGNGPVMQVNDTFATDVVDGKITMPAGVGLTNERLEKVIAWCRKRAQDLPNEPYADPLGGILIGTDGHPGAKGSCASAQTFDYAPPPPALGVAAVEREGKVVLTWKAAPEITELEIQKKAPGAKEFTKVGTATGRDKEWLDEALVTGSVYRIVATSKTGTAKPSNEAAFGGAA